MYHIFSPTVFGLRHFRPKGEAKARRTRKKRIICSQSWANYPCVPSSRMTCFKRESIRWCVEWRRWNSTNLVQTMVFSSKKSSLRQIESFIRIRTEGVSNRKLNVPACRFRTGYFPTSTEMAVSKFNRRQCRSFGNQIGSQQSPGSNDTSWELSNTDSGHRKNCLPLHLLQTPPHWFWSSNALRIIHYRIPDNIHLSLSCNA